MNAGWLLVRVLLGASLAAHGTQKLFGWFGGYGLGGTGGFMESLGFRPGKLFALAAGLCEGLGGLLVLLGLLDPVGPGLILIAMFTAMGSVHWKNGFFVTANGIEMPLAWVTCALAVAFAGPGRYSLDFLLQTHLGNPRVVWGTLVVAAVIAGANLLLRRPQPAAQAGPSRT
jgi:putative oxidoreductase